MTDSEQREAARQFMNKWRNGGDEKQDCHTFWLGLLHDVLGVESTLDYIAFEKPVKLREGDGRIHTRYIDGYIPDVKVLIEQKGSRHLLDEKEPQSGGEMLTPYEQAKRYNDNLPYEERARWIVTCNFCSLWIYDMNESVPEPTKVELFDLQAKYPLLDFLVKKEVKKLSHELEVSIRAGDIVGLIYDAFLKQYGIPETAPKNETAEEKAKREHKLRSLNALCVRLVFCLYAEDAPNLFIRHQFHDYLDRFEPRDCRRALIELFKTLDTPLDRRDEYLEDDLKAFPYVNGGLFADESIEIPQFTQEIKDLILKQASEDFDWKDISPTIFGAVFESTMNPETRRAGGLHYTSLENIHKVIDPLFLDDLKAEFEEIRKITQPRTKRRKLNEYQKKLASQEFLDPACGSGNFLTETYLSLRRLENRVLAELFRIQDKTASGYAQAAMIGEGAFQNPILVSIQQFYGIEINDFAVTVAKTALWIAESQMLEETKMILLGFDQDFFPLKTYVNITEGNALRIDWNDVVDRNKLNYIMGNPPFVGLSLRSDSQQKDMAIVFSENSRAGRLDYVAAWYKKAASFIKGTKIQAAFVSTNSISQGEQVPILWGDLFNNEGTRINFAYRTFVWDSEANVKAHVHCVIIGFANFDRPQKIIFEDGAIKPVKKINGYLVNADNVFIQLRGKAQKGFPRLVQGNKPWDGGNLILSQEERDKLIQKYPQTEKFIKKYIGSQEFINNKVRYCLWLKNVSPKEYRNIPEIMEKLRAVAEVRKRTKTVAVQAQAATPMLFSQIRQPECDYILIPETSSGARRYIPMGFMSKDVIASNSTLVATDATLYLFGVLESNVHMAWMRTICGRLKSDYRYSPSIYNNFPWPTPTDEQKARIEQTAQAILDARALYPDSSLADLYDPLTMPPELRKAHTANDIAVMKAYGFKTSMSESDCVGELMRMYQELVEKAK